MAWQVAKALDAPLDLLIVRKLGVPGQEELAMGAIASGGAVVVNDDVVRALGIPRVTIDRAIQRERVELDRRERLYRGERPFPETRGRYVILVDDGLATGATMCAAVAAMRQQQPSKVVVAVPVAPSDTIRLLAAEADQVLLPRRAGAVFRRGPMVRRFRPDIG